jgi:Na+/melibiose symporter-like transporter
MSPKQQQNLTEAHKWVTIVFMPLCFSLLVYIAKGTYELGQQNARDIVREHQVNEDQNQRLDRHEAKFVSIDEYLRKNNN